MIRPSSKPIQTGDGNGVVFPMAYEHRLRADRDFGMNEGDDFFMGKARVHETLKRIAKRLTEHGIPYAIAGGMALEHHGYLRFTDDVDILVTREGLQRIHDELDGRGFVQPFESSKNLRDAETGVKIEFLLTGDYPGDGKPKAIAFPDPALVCEEEGSIQYLNLVTLITLKLASGMTGAGRLKDFADVQELLKIIGLPLDLADSLPTSVQAKYRELWLDANPPSSASS